MKDNETLRVGGSSPGAAVFKPHGEYNGTIADAVVTAHVTGPFNREMVVALAGKVADFYRSLPREHKAGGITVFHESMMFTADAIDAFRELIAYELSLLPQGIVVAHVAGPEVEGHFLMPGIFAKSVYGPTGIPYQVFETIEAAERWVREQIAPSA